MCATNSAEVCTVVFAHMQVSVTCLAMQLVVDKGESNALITW